MNSDRPKIGRGFAAEACRQVGVSRTVFETARKKHKNGDVLTRNEIAVLIKYQELIKEAEENLRKLE